MKQIFTTFLVLCISIAAFSQYYYIPNTTTPGNPGTLNLTDEYPVGGGLSTSWTSIHSGSAATPQWTAVKNIPFSFMFNGAPVTQYKVSTSGVLTFDVATAVLPPYSQAALPSASIPDKSVAIWGLAGTGSNDNIVTQTFGTAPNRQHWVFFSSYNYANGGSTCWTYWSIVLEESTNKIYIVDQRVGGGTSCVPKLSVGIQIDNSTAVQVQGSPNLTSLAAADPTAADNFYYEFIQGTQPQYDVASNSVQILDYLVLGNAPYDVKANFRNLGTTPVTSFDLNYRVNGGSTVTTSVTGVNIATFGNYLATSSTKWNPTSVGTYNVEVWASNINGNPDQNTANDKSSKNVIVVNQITVKRPLVEDFGSATCPPCAPFAAYYDPILKSNNVNTANAKVNAIKYQMNWPSPGNDPFYNPDAQSRRAYYGINSIPHAMIDGDDMVTEDQAEINAYAAKPGFVEMDAAFSVWNNTINVTGNIKPLADFPNNNLKLRIAVVEDSIYYTGGTTTQSHYYQVMRKMLPDANGVTIGPFTSNVSKTFDQSYNFTVGGVAQGNYNIYTDMNSLSVVVFVQDDVTKDILQSTVASFSVGMQNIDVNNVSIKVYPNPAKDYINMFVQLTENKDVTANIVDVLGKQVNSVNFGTLGSGDHNLQLSTENLSSGIYFVEILSGNEKVSKKIVVNK